MDTRITIISTSNDSGSYDTEFWGCSRWIRSLTPES